MFVSQTSECKVSFLDCRGYFDLAAQIIGFIFTIVVFARSFQNYKELMHEKYTLDRSSTQYQNSVYRKAKVNLLNLLFLIVYLLHILLSMILFQLLNEMDSQQFASYNFPKWYKSSEILFIQLLNIVFLAVGWLYWHGLSFFFQVNQVDSPYPFSKKSKNVFSGLAACFVVVAGVGIGFTFADNDTFVVNLTVLISSGVSMVILVFYRLCYYKNIFRSARLATKVILRQRIYNFIIIFSSCSRIVLCLLQIMDVDYDSVRQYSNCIDISPFHAIILLFITLITNLLPSFVFSRIFTTFQRQRKMNYSYIEQTLFSHSEEDSQSRNSVQQ